MLSLIYVSSSVKLLNDSELLDILKASRDNNKTKDVTGMLLYKSGNFMQVLEGPDEAVESLYEMIASDPRHKDVTVLSREQIRLRRFTKWEMAFTNLEDPAIKNEPGYSKFLQDEFTASLYRDNPLLAYEMLITFRDNMR